MVEVKEQCAAQFVDKDEWSEMDSYTWSPDSRYLAYSKKLANRNASIMIFDTSDTRARQITSDYYSDTLPVFSTTA